MDRMTWLPGINIPASWILNLHCIWRGWSCCFTIQPQAVLHSTNANPFHSTAYSCKKDQNSALIMLSNWLWTQMRKWLFHKGLILAKPPSCFSRYIFFSFLFSGGNSLKALKYLKVSWKCLTKNHKTQNRKKKKKKEKPDKIWSMCWPSGVIFFLLKHKNVVGTCMHK